MRLVLVYSSNPTLSFATRTHSSPSLHSHPALASAPHPPQSQTRETAAPSNPAKNRIHRGCFPSRSTPPAAPPASARATRTSSHSPPAPSPSKSSVYLPPRAETETTHSAAHTSQFSARHRSDPPRPFRIRLPGSANPSRAAPDPRSGS